MVTGQMWKSKFINKKGLIQTSDDTIEVYIHSQEGDNEGFEQELSRHKQFLLWSWLWFLP